MATPFPQQHLVYCLGCGSDLTSTPTYRRALQGSGSQQVVELWKYLCENELEDESIVDLDLLVSGNGDPTKAGRMCRKCFSDYVRC